MTLEKLQLRKAAKLAEEYANRIFKEYAVWSNKRPLAIIHEKITAAFLSGYGHGYQEGLKEQNDINQRQSES